MILVDAIYINRGGGKVLLDYLIDELGKTDIPVFYLLDIRLEEKEFKIKTTDKILFLEPSLFKRYGFYKKHIKSFSTILCLGNIPSLVRTKSKVVTYFHNSIYLKTPSEFSRAEKIKYVLKVGIIKLMSSNTDYWWVQTSFIKERFIERFSVKNENVIIMPFFPPLTSNNTTMEREKYSYLYVSNATPNKNHFRLLDAFCEFYDEYKVGKLTLTVSDDYKEVVAKINEKIKQGYPIKNLGFVNKDELQKVYCLCEYHVYPSLSESFGLGLVEAIENGCKIIGADLPYTYAVCKPSLVFNPANIDSIKEAFVASLKEDVESSLSLVKNKIEDVIAFLNQ